MRSILLALCLSAIVIGESAPRVVAIVADSDNRFKLPGSNSQTLVLKAGEPLVLHITAHRGRTVARDGSVHGLVIRAFRDEGWDLRLKEGTTDVPIRAPSRPGNYLMECTVRCGPGHDDMNLKVKVVP